MTMAGHMQVPDPALLALRAQVRASMSKGSEPPAGPSSDARSVYVSCEMGASLEQCREFLESCGRISRVENTIPDKSVFRVEFESESSVESAMQLQSPNFVIVKCQSGASRLSPVPDSPVPEPTKHQNTEEQKPAPAGSEATTDDDDKEEGEVSDNEDGAVPDVPPVPTSSAFPPRRHSVNFGVRESFEFRREPEPANADPRREPDSRRPIDFGRPMEPFLPVHGGFFVPVPPAPAHGHLPVFNRYAVAPPYLGRHHRVPLPSESPIFFHRYSPIVLPAPVPPKPLPSLLPGFAEKPHGLAPPSFRPPKLIIDSVSEATVPKPLPSPQPHQLNENLIAELKRKAILSKGARSAADAKLDDGVTPKKRSKTASSSAPSESAGAASQASTDALQFLRNIVNSTPTAPVSAPVKVAASTSDPAHTPHTAALSAAVTTSVNPSDLTSPIPSASAVVKSEAKKRLDSNTQQPIRKRRPKSVARHPDDPFIIHLDGNTSDDTSDSESIGELGDDLKRKRAFTSDELQRIKANMKKLRQKIAAAEAASTNGNGVTAQENPSTAKLPQESRQIPNQTPLLQPDSSNKSNQVSQVLPAAKSAPAEARQSAKKHKQQPSNVARQSALQTRLTTIADLRGKISSLEQRRGLLRARLQITEQNVIRMKQMIERHDDEVFTLEAELNRQQSEFDMLTMTLNLSTPQQDGSQSMFSRSPTQTTAPPAANSKGQLALEQANPASQEPVAEEGLAISSVIDAVRSQISDLKSKQKVADSDSDKGIFSESSIVRQFHYESPITVSRGVSNPNAMVCQFSLFGHCNDDKCTMLHLSNPESSSSPKSTIAKDAKAHTPALTSGNSSVSLSPPFDESLGIATNIEESLAMAASGEIPEVAPTADDCGFISLNDQQRTDQECIGSVISLLYQAVSSSAGSDRYFCSTDAVSESDLEADPTRPGLWLRHCLQVARSDGASISDVLDIIARAISRNPKDVALYTAQLEISRLSPDLTDDQLLALARTACNTNPDSETLRSLLEQLSP